MAEEALHPHEASPSATDGMIPVDEARERVLSQIKVISPIHLPLTEAYGCVSAEDVIADGNLPAFASAAMDGYAVRAADAVDAGPETSVTLRIVGNAMIGRLPDATVGRGEAVRIATGAPIPGGADTIVPIEVAEADDASVRILEAPEPGRHIRPAGEDVQDGTLLVPGGSRIGAPELGLLASAGVATPLVHPRPRVVVLSTGDELVPPTEQPDVAQVRDANAYTIFSALRDAGAMPVLAGIVPDNVAALQQTVFDHLIQADAFISSGGVSVGERDVVKAAFFRRGDIDFYKVAMKPGKPQGFGLIEGKPYFGLPGNPVSVFVSFEVFVRPAVLKMMGRRQLQRPEITATLTEEIDGPKDKTMFARVRVARGSQGWEAAPTSDRHGSNLLTTVTRANGLAIIPTGVGLAPAGSQVRVILFRPTED
jgi:molybdopterin molybdotransferase